MQNLLKTRDTQVDKHVNIMPIHPKHSQARQVSPLCRSSVTVSEAVEFCVKWWDSSLPRFLERRWRPYLRQHTRRRVQLPWDRGFVDFVYRCYSLQWEYQLNLWELLLFHLFWRPANKPESSSRPPRTLEVYVVQTVFKPALPATTNGKTNKDHVNQLIN